MVRFCSLYSGSSGNALFLSAGGTNILIDCGLSARKVAQALLSIGADPHKIDAIVITHEHSDHIKGADVFSRKYGVPVYANQATWEAVRPLFGKHVKHRLFETGHHFEVKDIGIHTFPIPHDAVEPVGYRFYARGKKVSVATDIGRITVELGDALLKSDFVLLESNHDVDMVLGGSYPYFLKKRILGENGHLSNLQAGKIAAALVRNGTSKFVLGHLSRENNLPELALKTVAEALAGEGAVIGKDVLLEVARRDEIGRVIEI